MTDQVTQTKDHAAVARSFLSDVEETLSDLYDPDKPVRNMEDARLQVLVAIAEALLAIHERMIEE